MATVRQLAQLAGVSIWTVSRALQNDPRVHPDTRRRIQELAELYHYRSNRLSQGIFTGKSGSIGCIVPRISSPFFSFVLQGILHECFSESYEAIILESQAQFTRSCRAIQALVEKRVEGVLFATGHFEPIPRSSLLELRSHNVIPVALHTDCAI
ncbi:MAG: LacI family DNA-binding transcriptional regulator [Armatimonadota bacterium]